MPERTHTVHARMNTCSHINSDVRKHVLIHIFSLKNTHTHRHTQTPSLACVIYVFFLPAGQNESTCHDVLSVFYMHDSLQSGIITFGSGSRTVQGSVVVGWPRDI